jgi:hypothetical protein
MATRFVSIDRSTPMLLPCDLRHWLPANHIVHFILEGVEQLPLEVLACNARGTGSEQYPPAMMLGAVDLLLRHGAHYEQGYNARLAVEPVFGIIKEVIGFRRFRLRGRPKASLEWVLVGLSYNLKRMFVLQHQTGTG